MKICKRITIIIIIGYFITTGIYPSIAELDTEERNHNTIGYYPQQSLDNILKFEIINPSNIEEKADHDTIFNHLTDKQFSSNNKSWTWMFYDDADFFFAYDPLTDFSKEINSHEHLDVIVLQDKEYGPAYMWYIDPQHTPVLLEEMGEINMGNSQTLQDFLSYAKTHYPADRYILSFYDHGGGWRGVCWDDTDDDHLSMDDVQTALTNTGGVDIICNTAPCLMGALESAYELRDCVDVYIGSEEGSGYGHWYGTIENIGQTLLSNPEIENSELGSYIIQSLWENTQYSDMITMSAVKPSNMDALVSSLNTAAQTLITHHNESYNLFWETYQNVQSFGSGFCVDVYDLAEKYNKSEFNQDIRQSFGSVMDSFSAAIIEECHGDYPGAHGLTVYVPDRWSSYYNSEYGDPTFGLDFTLNTQWDEFVSLYFQEIIESGVDQYQTEVTSGMCSCSLFTWAQSFIPIKDGLKKVSLQLARIGDITSDLTLSIRAEKEGEDLTTTTIPFDKIPLGRWEWVTFNFADINVTPGQTYYILLSTNEGDNSANYFAWAGTSNSESYPQGDIWIYFTQSNYWRMWDPPIDGCFKTYFEDTCLDPPTITGPSSCKPGIAYEYSFVSHDTENRDISYYIGWGDGTTEGWAEPTPSGKKFSLNHTWDKEGSYIIKAKAKNTDGEETDWTTLEITMPKPKVTFKGIFQWFLSKHPNLFSLLNRW